MQPNYQNSPEHDGESTPGEKHLPGYSYCGPGTRLDIRLDDQNQPRRGEYPINAIDEACRIYDIAYRSGDLQHRHLADVK